MAILRRKVAGGFERLPVTYRPATFLGTAQYLVAPIVEADFGEVVTADQYAIFGSAKEGRLEQALVVA
ncbi:hypothetical protein D3C77_650340 [compost metagenome]